MGDAESRHQDRIDAAQEAAEDGVPPQYHALLGVVSPAPDGIYYSSDEARPRCPECVQGKHGNCDGTAYDDVVDEIVECGCCGVLR